MGFLGAKNFDAKHTQKYYPILPFFDNSTSHGKALKQAESFGIINEKIGDMPNIDISGVCYVGHLQSLSPGQKVNQTPLNSLVPVIDFRLLRELRTVILVTGNPFFRKKRIETPSLGRGE
jgi:hypothetical protein